MQGRDLIHVPLLLVSVAILVFGYILLGQGPVDSFASWKLAPVVLVAVYTILFPVSVLLKK